MPGTLLSKHWEHGPEEVDRILVTAFTVHRSGGGERSWKAISTGKLKLWFVTRGWSRRLEAEGWGAASSAKTWGHSCSEKEQQSQGSKDWGQGELGACGENTAVGQRPWRQRRGTERSGAFADQLTGSWKDLVAVCIVFEISQERHPRASRKCCDCSVGKEF